LPLVSNEVTVNSFTPSSKEAVTEKLPLLEASVERSSPSKLTITVAPGEVDPWIKSSEENTKELSSGVERFKLKLTGSDVKGPLEKVKVSNGLEFRIWEIVARYPEPSNPTIKIKSIKTKAGRGFNIWTVEILPEYAIKGNLFVDSSLK
jgi:hypothetical protein